MLRSAVVFGVICALVSFGAPTASAGTSGMLSGRVYVCKDFPCPPQVQGLQAAPFAKLKVTSLSGLGQLETTADATGYFAFVSLTPGRYFVVATTQGAGIGCIALARVSADQMTDVYATVLSARCLCHCLRPFKPSGNLPAWSIGPNGNFEI
jgi:hypothetical protein